MPQYVGSGAKNRDSATIIMQAHMIPIHELLNRIRWDSEFAKGNFQLGYYDRAEDRIILVPLQEITFPEDSPQTSTTSTDRPIEFRFTACERFTGTRNAFGIGARHRHIPDMAVSESYRDFVLEQLGRVTPVTGKSMFGDVGI